MIILAEHAIVLLIVLPLLAGAVLYLFSPGQGALPAVGAAWGLFALAVFAAAQVVTQGPQTYVLGGWSVPLGIRLRMDGISGIMILLVAVVGLCTTHYAARFFVPAAEVGDAGATDEKWSTGQFWPLWFLLWAGLDALFLTSDVFNAYVALEVLTLAAIGLIVVATGHDALVAATRYLFLSMLGSLAYLLGVGLLYGCFGVLDMGLLGARLDPSLTAAVAMALMLGGLMAKAALLPLHAWLPAAHANAPPPVSAALSGLVVISAFYLVLRLWLTVFAELAFPGAAQVLGLLGMAGILWGGLQALAQTRLKLVIAYSTVSQIGYLFLVFPLMSRGGESATYAWQGGLYLALASSCAKASAFLAAGALVKALGHDHVERMGGIAQRYPMLAYAFALAGLTLAGLPPSGGFVAKWMLLKAALMNQQWSYAIVIVGGGLLAVCYLFRVVEQTLVAPSRDEAIKPVSLHLQVPTMVLALVSAMLGLASWPLLKLMRTGVSELPFLAGGGGG